jgi:hypothetical protein
MHAAGTDVNMRSCAAGGRVDGTVQISVGETVRLFLIFNVGLFAMGVERMVRCM